MSTSTTYLALRLISVVQMDPKKGKFKPLSPCQRTENQATKLEFDTEEPIFVLIPDHIFKALIPQSFQASLGHVLFQLSEYHLEDPLAVFGLSISDPWAIVLGWSLAGLPFLPVVFGICIRLAWVSRGVNLYKVIITHWQ